MTPARLARLEQAFRVALAELGHCAAAWLFVREVAAAEGRAAVEALRDGLGRTFPVLDAVARRWLEGHAPPAAGSSPDGAPPGLDEVERVCAGAERVLVIGVEALHLDALARGLPGARLGLLRRGGPEVDWERVLANWTDRRPGGVEDVPLDALHAWAGPRSALVTFAYGLAGGRTHVDPAWVRVGGPDVRVQFRAIVAWDVLGAPMFVYPRWLVGVPVDDFSHIVTVPAGVRA